ncbi:MAG: oligosaccharide flippase family protein [Flavobacteriales bacterium]|nr:oligosaccharide flippase family protein [Flavobacteriales bacterium]
MGIIAKQASRNLVFIALGFLAGALNTLIVLPQAFENDPENWGLLRSLIAWFMILSQIFSFGSTNILIRYFTRYKNNPGPLLRFGLVVSALGILGLGLFIFFFGDQLISWSNGEHIDLLSDHFGLLFLLAANFIIFLTFQGYVNAILKSTFHQFLNETFLKSYYLGIAALYFFDLLNFQQLLVGLTGGYILATLALIAYSVTHGFTLRSQSSMLTERREMVNYGLYSILDRGAQTIVNNLDIIMIGLLIGLDDVGFFTLAAYIGTVTQMPQRAIQAIANPIVSKAIEQEDQGDLKHVYIQSALNQLILGGAIFLGIWVSIDELMSLMPGKYGNGKWVVLFIAISKLIYMTSGVSGGIIVYSKYFRVNLRFNLILIVLTITTNYFLVSPRFFDLGINGAAIATAMTYLIYNGAKLVFIRRKFGLQPLTRQVLIAVLLIAFLAVPLHMWTPFAEKAILAIGLKSALAVTVFSSLAVALKLSPDLNNFVRKFFGKTA